jgi:putative flippase GtrA
VGIGLTSAALGATYIVARTSSMGEGIAILAGMLAASCVRFVLLREWAFRDHSRRLRRSTGIPSSDPDSGALEERAA